MSKDKAIRILAEFSAAHLANAPVIKQIELYQALAKLLRSKPSRECAERIAFTLKEATQLQMDFFKHLTNGK